MTEHNHGCRVTPLLPPHWRVEAEFGGPNNCYRYLLTHQWGGNSAPTMLFAMMNPSGADISRGDMTVLKTSRIAQRHGCGGQIIVNACAYRAVSPTALLGCEDPAGPDNLDTIRRAAERATWIVVAHGNLPRGLQHHAYRMLDVLCSVRKPLYVLGLTGDGVPMHPLARGRNYIPDTVTLRSWWPSE